MYNIHAYVSGLLRIMNLGQLVKKNKNKKTLT